jgi:hypothetical protein
MGCKKKIIMVRFSDSRLSRNRIFLAKKKTKMKNLNLKKNVGNEMPNR